MSRRGTRSRTRRNLSFTRSQLKSLREDGEYRHRDISKLSKLEVPYDTIKNMEEFYRKNDPSVSQNKRAKRTATTLIKAWRTNNSGTRRNSRRSSNSSGTRRSRSRSNSSGTRRSRRSSGSRRSRSNSSGTRRSRRSSSRSLHLSDL